MADTDFVATSDSTAELPSENDGAIQYLLVVIAGREYGLRLDTLQEVLRFNPAAVAPVPNTPGWLEGVFSLRGTIISVVDLRLFLGLDHPAQGGPGSTAPGPREIGGPVARLLVLHSGEVVAGVVVDDIRGVLFVKPELVQPGTAIGIAGRQYLSGSYVDPKTRKLTWLLDTDRLIISPEMLVFEPAVF